MVWVVFIELTGDAAADILANYQQGLQKHESYASSRLLYNAEDKIYLLSTEWKDKVVLDVPQGSRVWSFIEHHP